MTLSVIIASQGRPTLTDTLISIAPQLQPGDELLVDVNDDSPWGNQARNRTMRKATSTHLMFMDDDDIYTPGAFQTIRHAVDQDPGRIHMFRMKYADGRPTLWQTPQVKITNVGTQNIVVPNHPERLAEWGSVHAYEGDYDFIAGCAERFGEPVWHDHITAIYRPAG